MAGLKAALIQEENSPGTGCSMSSTLFPTGLVPFEELFSKPPNPMLGPSLTQNPHVLDQEDCGKLTHQKLSPGLPPDSPQSGPSPSPSGSEDLSYEPWRSGEAPDPLYSEATPTPDSSGDISYEPPVPSQAPDSPHSETAPNPCPSGNLSFEPLSPRQAPDPPHSGPSFSCSSSEDLDGQGERDGPDSVPATEKLPPDSSPCWDFGDLFCKPPNPMLSSNVALSGSGSTPCKPLVPELAPDSLFPGPAPSQDSCPVPVPRPKAASPVGSHSLGRGKGGPKSQRGRGSGPKVVGKRKRQELGTPATQGKPEDLSAPLLQLYRQEKRGPNPSSEGSSKRGARRGGCPKKKKKRTGRVQTLGPQPPAPKQAPVSQEFIEKHTVVLGSKPVCKYFLAGRCIRGDQCRLDHNDKGLKFQKLCKFYVQGYCTRGELCRFLHQEFPCKFFHTGAKCYQGDHCGFSHAPLTPETEDLLRASLASSAPAPASPSPSPDPASDLAPGGCPDQSGPGPGSFFFTFA